MKTLGFANRLTHNSFPTLNAYIHSMLNEGGFLFFTNRSKNFPYIFYGHQTTRRDNFFELRYEKSQQFAGRILSVAKAKEVMDSSSYVIIGKMRKNQYLLGKGFAAVLPNGVIGPIERVLFIACTDCPIDKRFVTLKHINFFIDREVIYTDKFNDLKPAIKDFIKDHVGEIFIVNNVLNYVGEKITVEGDTLIERRICESNIIKKALWDSLELLQTEEYSSTRDEY